MRFLIISHVLHKKRDYKFYGYAPYVREMNLWLKYVDEVEVVAPLIPGALSKIDIEYQHKNKLQQAVRVNMLILPYKKRPIVTCCFYIIFLKSKNKG